MRRGLKPINPLRISSLINSQKMSDPLLSRWTILYPPTSIYTNMGFLASLPLNSSHILDPHLIVSPTQLNRSTMSTMPLQYHLGHFSSRKVLLHTYLSQQSQPALPTTSTTAPSPSSLYAARSNFDSNVVMVLSVLLCALICSLGLNSIIRCVFRCTSLVGSEISGGQESTTRLANTGIKKKVLKTFPVVSYSDGLQLPGSDKECAICLADFSTGERVKILPKCNHGFHVRCIDKWLSSHSSCPTCRHSLLNTCQKIVTGGSCRSTTSSQIQEHGPINTIIVSIEPLQHEGYLRNYES